jgi:hypothetical protein
MYRKPVALTGLYTVFTLLLLLKITIEEPEELVLTLFLLSRMLASAVCLFVAFYSLVLMYYVIKNRDIYRRNQKAVSLVKKARRFRASSEELSKLKDYTYAGVLTYNSYGQLRLSDSAVTQLFT